MDSGDAKRVFDSLMGGKNPSLLEVNALIYWITKEHERRSRYDAAKNKE